MLLFVVLTIEVCLSLSSLRRIRAVYARRRTSSNQFEGSKSFRKFSRTTQNKRKSTNDPFSGLVGKKLQTQDYQTTEVSVHHEIQRPISSLLLMDDNIDEAPIMTIRPIY